MVQESPDDFLLTTYYYVPPTYSTRPATQGGGVITKPEPVLAHPTPLSPSRRWEASSTLNLFHLPHRIACLESLIASLLGPVSVHMYEGWQMELLQILFRHVYCRSVK